MPEKFLPGTGSSESVWYFGYLRKLKDWHTSCFKDLELRVMNSTKVHKNVPGIRSFKPL
jgi:hypothetical protein